ncbi:HD-GYP domain, c-di-GMP phosphodiesterase class II (or its inactivated variant) [Anaerovirgula multivorans]|uniref:HD-GYP domain, c-di-GMP phosphodiesterase class II (Or its inactivated variant) n=1 Tax=Anaerovirgula multivorans TaxID=312168 RepID=A0A239HF74_9FIRM|nr:HD-GYP domain, c-di-GMP phosphodiesterase class II (or its inactivated variant) [Anaerovirgula multivorans]
MHSEANISLKDFPVNNTNKGGMPVSTNESLPIDEVHISDVKENMIVGREITNDRGVVLVPKEFVIRNPERFQSMLAQYNVFDVVIEIPKEEKVPEIVVVEPSVNSLKVKKFVEKFDKKREGLKNEFEKIIKGEGIQEKDLVNKIEETLEVFKEDMNIFQLTQKIKDLDDITYAHAHNVALISYSIGKWLDLKQQDLNDLSLAALLIDIGKIQIPQTLLNKKEQLTNDEWLELQKHVILSYDLIKNYTFISFEIKQAVLLHHEKIDGSGYPMGIKGDKIPLFARIIAIADIYSALTAKRPYRDKKTPFEAIKIMETQFMGKLDTNILYLFLNRIGDYFVGQKVKLSNGQIGEILFIPKRNIYRPIIKLENVDPLMDLTADANKAIEIEEFI